MEWTPDVSAGDWIAERVEHSFTTMHGVVPRGFEAYARIFHPATAQTLHGEPRRAPYSELSRDEVMDIASRTTTEPATWAQAADAFGTVMHPEAQWGDLVKWSGRAGDFVSPMEAPDDRTFEAPHVGHPPAAPVTSLAAVLESFTTTAEDVFVGVWEGRGGVQGGDDREGALSREVTDGPRLQLPGRGHIVFRGALSEFRADDWMDHMPWNDHPLGLLQEAPTLIWPADHAWAVVSEIDFDSTIVGGTQKLVDAVCSTDGLEALPIREGASLTYDADTINRP
ncbi:MAG: hypothetical protein QM774_08885 [Gordonia sp. (in: high G+C Gram-positive bacteria)]|uniref:hypothetical protein n=1 Tax=Gordonia sp. (in: high G+C Gram-positive bacteria) TaxID=84139 RepID=UPI0039E3CBB9